MSQEEEACSASKKLAAQEAKEKEKEEDEEGCVYCVCIDFEACGGVTPKNGFFQLGAVVLEQSTITEVDRFNMYASQEGLEKEERCMTEFWSQHADLYAKHMEKCEKEAGGTCAEVVEKFWLWLDETLPPEKRKRAYFIGDNVAFDYGILRAFSRTRNPLYAFGSYREVVDVSTYYNAFSRMPLCSAQTVDSSSSMQAILKEFHPCTLEDLPEFFKQKEGEEHCAVQDALTIAMKWAWFNACKFEKGEVVKSSS